MRSSLVLPIAAAVAVFAIEPSGQAVAASGGMVHRAPTVVRDHRVPPVVQAPPVIRDHRSPPVVVVRDHRVPPVVQAPPVIRDHRSPPVVVVRDHRVPPVVRDHRAEANYDKTPARIQVVVNGRRVPR
jgi:hypothetical protein